MVADVLTRGRRVGWQTQTITDVSTATRVIALGWPSSTRWSSLATTWRSPIQAGRRAGERRRLHRPSRRPPPSGIERTGWRPRITDLDRIHGPAGLAIGASTPAEIAVSIVAEALADWYWPPSTYTGCERSTPTETPDRKGAVDDSSVRRCAEVLRAVWAARARPAPTSTRTTKKKNSQHEGGGGGGGGARSFIILSFLCPPTGPNWVGGGVATALFVAMSLGRPILLEGEVGVGKTEVAKALASVFGRRLIRLQCYEGIDTNQALYEWDYARQMLQIRALSERRRRRRAVDKLFGPKFLLERPAARGRAGRRPGRAAHRRGRPGRRRVRGVPARAALRLPDHHPRDRHDPRRDAAGGRLTSNRTRELHDALKRRCLYHWVGYPSPEREVEIVLVRHPGSSEALARKVVAAVNRLRALDLAKPPGSPRPSTGCAPWTSSARPS